MKKQIFILTILSVFTTILSAQTTSWTNQDLGNNNLNEVMFINDEIGYIAADSGTVYKTTDSGSTWVTLLQPDVNDVVSVAFVNENEGMVVTRNSVFSTYMYRTINGGMTWDAPINHHFSTSGFCFPQVLKAQSGNIYIGGNGCFYGEGICVFDGDTLRQTYWEGGGAFSQRVNNFYFRDSLNGYATTLGGAFYKTLDAGQNWTKHYYRDSMQEIYDILFVDADTGYMVVRDTSALTLGAWAPDVIVKTVDGGVNWTREYGALFVTPDLKQMASIYKDSIIVVGSNMLGQTSGEALIGGRNIPWWSNTNVDTSTFIIPILNDVTVLPGGCVFIVGDSGVVYNSCFVLPEEDSVTITNDVLDIRLNKGVKLYPIPASNKLTIEIEDEEMLNSIATIYDMQGKVITSKEIKSTKEEISLDNIATGSYCTVLETKKGIFRSTFIVKK